MYYVDRQRKRGNLETDKLAGSRSSSSSSFRLIVLYMSVKTAAAVIKPGLPTETA